ncbi:hypothetical protein Cs7R123_01500 [Catellatospora sp. TT07R-123]|nr:hypothetical protein [Catellatospora sp. TT07R-123]GHJ42808.1 hypothetical protein Cs7R123_01500 [Catellatospora sp. TT07R-123]
MTNIELTPGEQPEEVAALQETPGVEGDDEVQGHISTVSLAVCMAAD